MKERSAKAVLIEDHYQSIAPLLDWDVTRFKRLCAALRFTPEEMASFLRVRPVDLNKWLRVRKFPGTVELHLTLIEQTFYPGDTKQIFPFVP